MDDLYSREERFFPNECTVCKSREKINRCVKCKMVYYCGKEHQKQHWPTHRTICKGISKVLERKGLSYIFENIPRSDFSTYIREKQGVIHLVEKGLGRALSSSESGILKFPRICFVCREAKQDKLKNCPGCPAANFCNLHPSSELHNKNCAIMRNRIDIVSKQISFNPQVSLNCIIKSIGEGTKILKPTEKPPASIKEFFDNYTNLNFSIPEIEKIYLSDVFTIPLTVFRALQTIYDNFPPEIVIHIDSSIPSELITIGKYWETLLHLLPGVKCLKIVHVERQITHSEEITLCKDCVGAERRLFLEANSLAYETYINQRNYQIPSIFADIFVMPFKQVRPDLANKETSVRLSDTLPCPIVMTTKCEREESWFRKELLKCSAKFRTIYNGSNDFRSLTYIYEEKDGALLLNCQTLLVYQQEKFFMLQESKLPFYPCRMSYYPSICHVCGKPNPEITCNQCQIVSYCGPNHQNQDHLNHTDICEIVSNLLIETETSSILEKAKTFDSALWLRAKIDLLKNVQKKLGRPLEEYEEQMFFFPKACIVCHESDFSQLLSCKCGASLCKIHKDDPKHEAHCTELLYTFQYYSTGRRTISPPGFLVSMELPSSMLTFIDSFREITGETSTGECYQDSFLSDLMSPLLTLSYVLKKLENKLNPAIVIHLIETSERGLSRIPFWPNILSFSPWLSALKIIFIGPNLSDCRESIHDALPFSFEVHAMTYDKYFLDERFVKPDIIMGCNLHIHESELDIFGNNYKETILTLAKVGVPFILTAGTKERAEKDHKMVCELLEKPVDFVFLEENPFSSIRPQRDFETEGVMYPNKSIIVYDGKYESSTKVENEQPEIACNFERLQSEIELSEPQVNDSEVKIVELQPAANTKNDILEKKDANEENNCAYQTKTTEEETETTSDSSKYSSANYKLANSESFVVKHNSFLKIENKRLREQLDCAVEEIEKLQQKILEFKKIYAKVVDRNNSIREVLCDVEDSMHLSLINL